MRLARYIDKGRDGYYHLTSHTVDKTPYFSKLDKERFLYWLVRYAEFCGIKICENSPMSNHIHVLAKVPCRPAPDALPDDQELIRLLALVSSKTKVKHFMEDLQEARERGDVERINALREKVLARMWNLSKFMQQLLSRFAQEYNRRYGRKGALWRERFRSSVVEDNVSLVRVAAYIALNPVRAGMVRDPLEYRWSGYAQLAAGDKRVWERGAYVLGECIRIENRKDFLKEYRKLLYIEGAEVTEGSLLGGKARSGFKEEDVNKVLERGGELTMAEMLRVKVRYFGDGLVIGSREFVEQAIERYSEYKGRKRKSRPVKMKGGCWGDTYVLRVLRKNIFEGKVYRPIDRK